MEPEQLREIVKENNSLETKLTKRNQQYIFDFLNCQIKLDRSSILT